ncbi:MAG: single-stranded DNA-binding protein [Candidatus Omnitrophota bacterium]
MASLNKVLLMGNLTRDPELRYIPSGSAVTTFTVAMNRVYKLQTGEKKEEVSFVRVVVWGRTGELCGEYLKKGSLVFVEGRLQSRSWDGPDGQKRNTIEVIAMNVQFLNSRGQASGAGPASSARAAVESPEFAAGKEDMPEIQLDEPPIAEGPSSKNSHDDVPF